MTDAIEPLRRALRRGDPAAAALRRHLARHLTGTRLHELVCVIAEHAWHGGEACRADALLRFAARIRAANARCDAAPADALVAAIDAQLPCEPRTAREPPPGCALLLVDYTCALARLDPDTLEHHRRLAVSDRWLLITPIARGGGKLAARCAVLVDAILVHHNRAIAAPHDPSYIAFRDVDARIVPRADAPALAATLRRSAWSPSPFVLVAADRCAPLSLEQLLALAGA